MSKQQLGKQGEALAADYLEREGYVIQNRNWHCKRGEIDIVAYDDNTETWVFCEVKTRRSNSTDKAFASITPQKQKKLITAVQIYLHAHDLDDVMWRIDAIGVAMRTHQPPMINHVEDALAW